MTGLGPVEWVLLATLTVCMVVSVWCYWQCKKLANESKRDLEEMRELCAEPDGREPECGPEYWSRLAAYMNSLPVAQEDEACDEE